MSAAQSLALHAAQHCGGQNMRLRSAASHEQRGEHAQTGQLMPSHCNCFQTDGQSTSHAGTRTRSGRSRCRRCMRPHSNHFHPASSYGKPHTPMRRFVRQTAFAKTMMMQLTQQEHIGSAAITNDVGPIWAFCLWVCDSHEACEAVPMHCGMRRFASGHSAKQIPALGAPSKPSRDSSCLSCLQRRHAAR